MNSFFSLLKIEINNSLVWRAQAIIWTLHDVSFIIVLPFVWLTIYGDRPEINNFTQADIVTYSILLMMESLSFWLHRIDNIHALHRAIIALGRYPTVVFGRIFQITALTILPITVLTNFPAMAIFNRLDWYWIPYSLGLAVAFLIISRLFFKFAVKHYSSASS